MRVAIRYFRASVDHGTACVGVRCDVIRLRHFSHEAQCKLPFFTLLAGLIASLGDGIMLHCPLRHLGHVAMSYVRARVITALHVLAFTAVSFRLGRLAMRPSARCHSLHFEQA